MKIDKFIMPQMDQNTYLVREEDGNIGFIIDPGSKHEEMEDIIEREKLEIPYILLTHGHYDHIASATYYRDLYGAKICCGKEEGPVVEDPDFNLSREFGDNYSFKADIFFEDGDIIDFIDFKVISCPGHSPGGVSYLYKDKLFTGDTLFKGSCGRWDLPGGNLKKLLKSLARLFMLDDKIEFYPGHGPSNSLYDEKRNNPMLPYVEHVLKRKEL